MVKKMSIVMLLAVPLLLTGCHSGDSRLFNDALSSQPVRYDNRREVQQIGAIKVTYGIKNNQFYEHVANTSRDYCKLWMNYEDGSRHVILLNPKKKRYAHFGSLYNTLKSVEVVCDETDDVFNEPY